MNIVVGVDEEGIYRDAVHLLGRLRFAEANVMLIHVREPLNLHAYMGVAGASCTELERSRQRNMDQVLDDADRLADFQGVGESYSKYPLTGSPASEVMLFAERAKADLVAIGSRQRGNVGSFFMGSVGRALAIGARESFLVARGGAAEIGQVRAVFATDHSDYANACFKELLRLNPTGISEICFTFADYGAKSSLASAAGLPQDCEETSAELREKIRVKGAELVDRCLEAGIYAQYNIVDGFPIDAVQQCMEDTKSDLLILGAKGHGFMERLLVGSFTLHAVVAEPYSVLVLRLPA